MRSALVGLIGLLLVAIVAASNVASAAPPPPCPAFTDPNAQYENLSRVAGFRGTYDDFRAVFECYATTTTLVKETAAAAWWTFERAPSRERWRIDVAAIARKAAATKSKVDAGLFDGMLALDDDNDGIRNSVDVCKHVAEDRDRFADDDGCPESDNDFDAVPDATDDCGVIPDDDLASLFSGAAREGCPPGMSGMPVVIETGPVRVPSASPSSPSPPPPPPTHRASASRLPRSPPPPAAAGVEYPEWVMKGSGVFGGNGDHVIYGVGVATEIKNHSLRRVTSDNRARAEVAKVLEVLASAVARQNASAFNAQQFVADATAKIQIVDHWFPPNDNTGIYALAQIEIDAVRDLLPSSMRSAFNDEVKALASE